MDLAQEYSQAFCLSEAQVYVESIDDYININEVKVTNMSENFYGEDVATFEYEGKEYESTVTIH